MTIEDIFQDIKRGETKIKDAVLFWIRKSWRNFFESRMIRFNTDNIYSYKKVRGKNQRSEKNVTLSKQNRSFDSIRTIRTLQSNFVSRIKFLREDRYMYIFKKNTHNCLLKKYVQKFERRELFWE